MKRYLFSLAIAFTIILLTLFIKDIVREKIIVPVLEFVQIFNDLPQGLLWFFFIGILMVFEWKTLAGRFIRNFGSHHQKSDQMGRIETLSGLIRQARRDIYFKQKLSRYLGELTFVTLAYTRSLSPEIIKEQLASDRLDVAPEILAYLKAGLEDHVPHTKKRRRFIQPVMENYPIELDPTTVVEFLEQQLEVHNDRKEY